MSNTRIYKIWTGVKQRAKESGSHVTKYYEHVTIDDEWLDFNKFYQWSMENGYQDSLSLDRINGKLGYFPENCRWADKYQQARNKSDNRNITAFGETKTTSEWGRDYRASICSTGIRKRIDKGMSPEEAITTPPRKFIREKKDGKS